MWYPSSPSMTLKRATIADRIRWLIDYHGITQGMFAARAGMAPSQLSVLLQRLDQRPYAIELETVIRLAGAGGAALRWLLLGEGAPFGEEEPDEAPPPPPLQKHPWLQSHLIELHNRGFRLTNDLVAWLERVCLPLDHPDELTAEVVGALVRLRLQMLYGRAAEPVEYDLRPFAEREPRMLPATPSTSKGKAPKSSATKAVAKKVVAKKAPPRRGR
jgi:hypothetical protein